MKKLHCAVIIAVILIFTVISGLALNVLASNQRVLTGPEQEGIDIHCQDVSISNGYYNVSVSVDAIQSMSIYKILINPANVSAISFEDREQAKEEIGGVNTYINSTAVSMAHPLNYQINSGDHIEVNFIIPCIGANQSQMVINIFTNSAEYWYQVNLNSA